MTILARGKGLFFGGGERYTEFICILSGCKRNGFKLHTTKQHSNFNGPVSVGERFFSFG